MGMSVAAASAILFTAFLVVATVLFTAIDTTIMGVENRFNLAQDHQNDYARTVLRVDNVTNNTTVIFINATNIGSSTLKINELNILVNGTPETSKLKKHSIGGNTATNIWAPNERLYLELTFKTKKNNRVEVVAGNGASATGLLT